MKIGIVGAGAVGSACLMATVMRGAAREIVLVDRTRERARAVAADIRYGAPLSPAATLHDGDYGDLAGASLVMITAGINEKSGGATDRSDSAGRLRLLEANAQIYDEIVPRIAASAPDAILLVVTDPPDPLADHVRRHAPQQKVLSTGTFLDSLRFSVHLAAYLAVDPRSVDAQILGEHGTTEVFAWSAARVGGLPLLAALAQHGLSIDKTRVAVEREVRFANIAIIEGNKASQYGIGMVSARIAEMILRDEQTVVPIGSYSEKYGVTLSLPSVIGRQGVLRILEPALSDEEERALERSADALREALRKIRAPTGR